MYFANNLSLYDFTVEHLHEPLGLDVSIPRFAWKLRSDDKNIMQQSYRLQVFTEAGMTADSGPVESDQSIEVTIPGFTPFPMTAYRVQVCVWDNQGRKASLETTFETGRMGASFTASWVEPEQEPTVSNMDWEGFDPNTDNVPVDESGHRTFEEFRPAQYVRIPFHVKRGVRRARVYATAHGLYALSVNGRSVDDRELAPENTAYQKILLYQTYDITERLQEGENVIGVILADGWWVGRVGTTGDCCQYGNTTALLLEAEIEYMDGTKAIVTGEQGKSHTGPILFSDLFVGEKYDARLEASDWDAPGFDDSSWLPVQKKEYDKTALRGQRHAPVQVLERFRPLAVFTAPNGDIILDAGQNVAGVIQFTVTADAGRTIKFEHFETLGKDGNYFASILNANKEQTVWYITRAGRQTFRPHFTYHGFRYVRISGWPGMPTVGDFLILPFASAMDDLG